MDFFVKKVIKYISNDFLFNYIHMYIYKYAFICFLDTIVIRPSFSTLVPGFSSYIAYGVSNSVRDTMELKLKLIPHTLDQISLIAYLGQSGSRQELSDHLSITYVRGYIMLTWDLGSGKSLLMIIILEQSSYWCSYHSFV